MVLCKCINFPFRICEFTNSLLGICTFIDFLLEFVNLLIPLLGIWQFINYLLDFVNSLRPVQYNKIGSTKKRTRYGLIAQEVSESLGQFGKTTQDFKGLNTGSSKVASYEKKFEKPISEIVSSGSYNLSKSS